MKIYLTILYVVGTIVVKNSVSGKSLIFNKYSNGPHFEVQKQEDAAFDDSKGNLDQEGVEDLINSYKRSVDEVKLKPLKRNTFENSIQKRSPYGLVYNQGKPIGILEPIAQSFEYSSYGPRDSPYRNSLYKSQWFPVKRSSELDMDEIDKDQLESQTSALHSSNYANVLAKFKVNNKVKHRPYQDYLNSQVKRATSEEINRRKDVEEVKKRGALDMGNLKANAKSKSREVYISDESSNKADGGKIDEIEENLKDVMGDMGLVEKDKEIQTSQENNAGVKKREIYFEDEDLENGLNKIGLTKEAHYDRNKKEDCPGKTKVAKSKGSRKISIEKNLHKKGKKKVKKDDETDAKRSVKANRKRVAEKKDMSGNDIAKAKIANYQYEGEEFIRRKRQGKEAEKAEDSEIMKDLETSGDLTVSGNKSPLVAVTNADDPELKKNQEKRDKEELEYEKRLERNIQAKINAIKEEVKREITMMKDVDKTKKEQQRKKREVTNTLLDGETNILDPRVNIDQKLEPHIRKRRDLNNDLVSTEKANTQKLELKSDANSDGMTSSKTVREASKTLSSNNINQETATVAQKVKRSETDAKEVKSGGVENNVGGDTSLTKREDKLVESAKEVESSTKGSSGKSVAKRQAQDLTSKQENSQETAIIKEVEKRDDAFTATDKVETDNKAEFGTDAPDSIVKRNDQEIVVLNNNEAKTDSIVTDAANIMKRDEKELGITTDKCIDSNNDVRQDRSAKGITDLQTGQTLVNLEDDSDIREERESNDNLKVKTDVKSMDEIKETNDEREEEAREERSANSNKGNKPHDVIKQAKLTPNHKTIRRNTDNENDLTEANAASFVSNGFEKKLSAINADSNEVPLNEQTKETSIKQRNVQSESSDQTNDAMVEERSVSNHKLEDDDSINERSAYSKHNISSVYADAELVDPTDLERGTRKAANKSITNFPSLNSDDDNLNDEISDEELAIEVRRRRRMANQKYAKRHKRDETSYSENKPELINYRADNDGEIDDEDDEMHDDGFDDQTSNFLNKRQADYDSGNYESNEDQETNEEYPLFMERNKRNALRVYDDENDAEESYDNFLFYPNKYSRMKRHNYENLAAIHGGGMTQHAAALRERNMQPYQQNLRRKRLEKMNRMHEQNGNVGELSESDIFGGFPQSYEGELSRFKRVKRSYLK